VHSSLLHTGVKRDMAGAKLIEWANEQNTGENMAGQALRSWQRCLIRRLPLVHVGHNFRGNWRTNITAKDCRFVNDLPLSRARIRTVGKITYLEKGARVEEAMHLGGRNADRHQRRCRDSPLRARRGGEADKRGAQITGDNASHKVS